MGISLLKYRNKTYAQNYAGFMHKNILIGITGNIASGKSSIMKYCLSRGFKTFIADDVVHNLYERIEVQEKVKELLPELTKLPIGQVIEIFFSGLLGHEPDFPPINRERLAKIIFKDEQKRRALEALIHPMVTKELKDFACELGEGEIGFAEVPLLFETHMENIFDYIILVHCDRDIRLKRARERGIFRDKFDMIDGIQVDDEKKKERADFVIDSNAGREVIHQKMDEIIESLRK